MPLLWLTVTVGLMLANLIANRLAWASHLTIGLLSALALVAVARLAGLTLDDVGVDRRRWGSGLRWGTAAAGVVVAGYAIALAVPPAREALAGAADESWPATLGAVLVVIPLGTVLPEELAFRGVLWALLRRRHGEWGATAGSSVLFGLWHVLPALGGSAVNEIATGTLGGGEAGTVIRVLGAVLVTTAAGVGFCWLRVRSGSLLAPMLLHWAVNGLGLLAVKVA